MDNKLIIWDFDGVIADTEIIWLTIRMNAINKKFNINFNIQDMSRIFAGTNDKLKQKYLYDHGYPSDENFWNELFLEDINHIKQKGIKLTDNIEKIFELNSFEQCIATSGGLYKTNIKIDSCGIRKFFSDDRIFTADNVKVAKPEPDLFLYAAKHMGYEPKDCIVVEDSIAGMTAGKKAGMTVIAYIQHCYCNKQSYINDIKKLGINLIFDNMNDLKKYFEEYKNE